MATTNETVDITINGNQAIQTLRNIDRNIDTLTNGFSEFMAGVAEGMTSAAKDVDKMRGSTEKLKDSTTRIAQVNRTAADTTTLWTNTLSRLAAVIGGIGIGALVNSTRLYAQQVQNASNATGVASTVVQQFANSVARSGGQVDNAVESIIEFSEKINEAREGNQDMIRSFEQAGVTLKELYSGDTQAIFQKTISGLTRIGDATIRNTASAKLLGEQFKKLDIRGVSGGMSISASVADPAAIKAAAAAQANLNVQLQNLTNAILEVLKPLNQFVANINIAKETIKEIIEWVWAFVKAIGGLFILGKLFKLFQQFRIIVSTLKETFTVFGKEVGFFKSLLKALWNAINSNNPFKYITELIKDLVAASPSAAKSIEGLGIILKGFIVALGAVATAAVKRYWDKIFGKDVDAGGGRGEMGGPSAEEMKKYYGELEEQQKAAKERADQQARAQWTITAAIIKQRDDLETIIRQYKQTTRQSQLDLQNQIDLVGATEDRIELSNALTAADSAYYEQLRQIETKQLELRNAVKYALAGSAEQKQAAAELAEFERNRISLVIRLSEEYAKHRDNIIVGVGNLQTARTIETERLNVLQRISDAYERQRNLAASLSEINRTMVQRQQDLGFERSLMGRGGFERDLLTARRELDRLYMEQSQAIAEAFSVDGEIVDVKGYSNAIARLAEQFRILKQTTNDNAAAARRWSTGWDEALENFFDQTTNMADIARNVFGNLMSSMENALDNFVRTGKLGFKDLVRSIVLDLTSMALKQAFRNLFMQMAMAKGGFFGSIGSFLGSFITASPLSSGGAGGGAGRLNSGGSQSSNNVISNMLSNIVNMANGMNKMMTTMASNSVMANGSNMSGGVRGGGSSPTIINNYNISAIDSRSVAQFFAENRKTVYGTVMQAQKEMPTRSRGMI